MAPFRPLIAGALVMVCCHTTAQEIGPYGFGFRGDGTGVYPGCNPPTTWSDTQGVAWKARLPNWGYSCPVPVPGRDLVLMMTEPFPPDYWPQLNCFDAKTGKSLWKVAVNPLDAFPDLSAKEKETLTADIAWVHDGLQATYRICHPLMAKGRTTADEPIMQDINQQLAKYGLTVESYTPGYGLLRKLKYLDEGRKKAAYGNLAKYGIAATTTWQNFGSARVGTAFPTPVTDGERIYVMTVHGTVACFDLMGQRCWSRFADSRKGGAGKLRPLAHLMASPRLCGDLLLTAFIDTAGGENNVLYAWDRITGTPRWQHAIPGTSRNPEARSRPGGALVVMTVGDKQVALCSTGHVVGLPEGTLYAEKIDKCCGTYAVDDGGDVVFGCGHDDRGSIRWAYALTLVGNQLAVVPRYTGGPKSAYGPVSAVFVDGRLFVDKAQVDPTTGCFLGAGPEVADARKANRTGPESRHLLLAAGGHVYGLRERRPGKGQSGPVTGVCEVFSNDGKKVAENVLTAGPWDEEAAARWEQQGFGHSFSYSCSMNIAGNSIYLCSQDFLYRIGG